MAGPFELRRPGPPMPEVSAKIPAQPAQPAQPVQDRFLSMLRENGLAQDSVTPSVTSGGPSVTSPTPPPSAPSPQVFQGLPQFGQFAREPLMPRPPQNVTPSVTPEPPAPPAEFKPGEPGAPKSGLTVHQLAKDEGLQTAVSKWFRTTGKSAIKGPDLMALLKEQAGMDMSVRQAAGLAKRLTHAETLRREDPARDATRKGAARAMKAAKEG